MVLEKHRNGEAGVIGLLDIGSFKIACLIVALSASRTSSGAPYRVVGVGHQRSKGVKAGVITNLDEAEASVRAAIAQAERMAGVTLDEVIVSVSCGRLKSKTYSASAEVEGRTVSAADIERVMAGGRSFAERDGRTIIHLNRLGYRLDGVSGMRDLVGMAGRKITADLHAVTADDAPVRNLLMVIERCYLQASGLVPAGLASAMAATTEEERRLGVTCIDIGGGTTTLSVFADSQFIFTDTVPMGSGHISYDIARNLQTPLAEAERIKALYGTVVWAPSDEHEIVSYPVAGSDDGAGAETTKARLSAIIRPRLGSLLGTVRERLEQGGMAALVGDHVVLTGGGSQLVGMAEFAAEILGRQARLSRPSQVSGLPPALSGPAFSCVAGLLSAAALAGAEQGREGGNRRSVQGYLGLVGEWLKQGF